MQRLRAGLESESVQATVLLVFAFSIFFVKLWQGALGGDESCYALLSREILRTGDWLVLHHPTFAPWTNFYEHPPLYMWATALNFAVFGVSDFAAKLFSASCGFLTVVLLYVFARKESGPRFAVLATTMLCLTLFFVDYGRKARLENPLTFFVFASFVAIVWALQHRRVGWAMVAGAAMGLGFLVKGMPAAASGVVALGAVLPFQDTWKRRVSHLLAFGLGAIVVMGPWVAIQLLVDEGRFFEWYVNRQVEWSLAGRTPDGSSLGIRLDGFVYYAKHLFLEIMVPWGVLGVAGAVAMVRRRRWREEHAGWVAILAVLVIVGVFALIPFRKARYVLPAVPFLAFLAADLLARRSWSERASTYAVRLVAGLLVALLAVAALTPVPFYTKKDGDFLPFAPYVDALTEPGESVLVGGMAEYTVRQVFTWYFDRPQTIVRGWDEFEAAWRRGEHDVAIYRIDGSSDAPDDAAEFGAADAKGSAIADPGLTPHASSGPYRLFLRESGTVRPTVEF